MARFELQLVTKIVDTGNFVDARKAITSDHFITSIEARSAWNFIVNYHMQHGVTPSRDILAASIPRLSFESIADPVAALVDKVKEAYVYNQIQLFAEHTGELAVSDIKGAAEYIADASTRFRLLLSEGVSSGVDLTMQAQEEIDAYYRRKDSHGILGISWPWDKMNKITLGIQDSQLIVFYARPGSMKTWLLLYVLLHAYYVHRKRIVLFTREMTAEELRRRICALWAGLSYSRYMSGSLTSGEEARWIEAMQAFSEMQPIIIDTVPGAGAEAADLMIEKAKEYGAEMIGVDGVYFFGNREWELIGQFTSRLKFHLLNTYKVPCLATAQGSKAGDVAYSDTILQDADILVKQTLLKDDERIHLQVLKARESENSEFHVWAKPAMDFSQAFVDDAPETNDSKDNVQELTQE